MALKNNKQWGRSTKVNPKRQSFKSYIEGASEWAKKNLITHCKICGIKSECKRTVITDNNIIAIFRCDTGHTTTQTAKESELRRAYNTRD